MTATVFLKWRNRAVAQLAAGINGSVTDIALVAGQGARLTQVLTASGDSVRAQIIERDPTTGEVIACELVDITNNVSDVLKVTRGVEATRATDDTNTYSAAGKIFSSAAYIEEVISSEVISQMQDAINAVEDGKVDKTTYKAERTVYGSSSTGSDDYAITTGDSLASVVDGRIFAVRADVANNGAATLNVDGLGAIALKKLSSGAFADLSTWDIIANQIFFAMRNTAAACYQFSLDPATLSLAVSDADEITKGISERATNTEALDFVDITRFINSLQLWLATRCVEQDIPYAVGAVTQNASNLRVQSTQDGSELFMVWPNASATSWVIIRLARENSNGHYVITHRQTITPSSGVDNLWVCPVGDYVYIWYSDGGTKTCKRYLKADLSGITSITISGTNWTAWGGACTDGTYLYVFHANPDDVAKYSISGTTITYVSTITYTSSGNMSTAWSFTCDGTYVWCVGAIANATVIRKYALAWGAALSSTTRYFYYDALSPTTSPIKLFIPKKWVLACGYGHGTFDQTNHLGSAFKIQATIQP